MVRKTLADALRSTERQIKNLIDLRLQESIPQDIFEAKSRELDRHRIGLQERIQRNEAAGEQVGLQVAKLLDFGSSLKQSFLEGSPVQQRIILESVASNYTVRARKVAFQMEKPLTLISEASGCSSWLRLVDDVRTWYLTTTETFRVPKLDSID